MDDETLLSQMRQEIQEFSDARDWNQFHKPKEVAAALAIEAAELQALYLWRTDDESRQVEVKRVKQELADVFILCLTLANVLQIDVSKAVRQKLELNAERYPVEKSRGNARKYSEF